MNEIIPKSDFVCYGILDFVTQTFIGVGVTLQGAQEDARIFVQENYVEGRNFWPTKTVRITVRLLEKILMEGYSYSAISFTEDHCFADVR